MDTKDSFPECDAWAASIPPVRNSFSASSPRRIAAGDSATPADLEFKAFAALDLSNM